MTEHTSAEDRAGKTIFEKCTVCGAARRRTATTDTGWKIRDHSGTWIPAPECEPASVDIGPLPILGTSPVGFIVDGSAAMYPTLGAAQAAAGDGGVKILALVEVVQPA